MRHDRGAGGRSSKRTGLAVLCLISLLVLLSGADGLAFSPLAWLFGASNQPWPVIERMEIDLDLSAPPRFAARGVFELSGIDGRSFSLLLNKQLEFTEASVNGGPVTFRHGPKLRSSYHKEGRVVRFFLPEDPEDGKARLEVRWEGNGEDGTGPHDWRGLLLLASDELRMSEQTIFYPQAPTDEAGPGVRRAPGLLTVRAPRSFELFAPGQPVETPAASDPAVRTFCFEMKIPTVLSIIAGPFHRHESRQDGMHLVSLLLPVHRDLGPEMIEATRRAVDHYSSRFGPVEGIVLGICEITCRGGTSYNWASQGLIVFDRGALGAGVPEHKIGHEVAHLWWGNEVSARGKGERFLTEGLAEYSSWGFVRERHGEDRETECAREARRRYLDRVHRTGSDPALGKVEFSTPGYQQLAYDKGALALRALEKRIGREELDSVLRRYRAAGTAEDPTLETFLACLSETRPGIGEDLTREGHAHLEVVDPRIDREEARFEGTIRLVPCPRGIPALPVERLTLEARSRQETRVFSIKLEGAATPLSLELPSAPDLIRFDPEVSLLAELPEAYQIGGARLLRSDPAPGSRDVPAGARRIVLEFDRPLAEPDRGMRRALRDALNEQAKAGNAARLSIRDLKLANEGRSLILETEVLLPGKRYVIPARGVLTDTAGVPVLEGELHFETEPSQDRDPPRIVATVPDRDQVDVPVDLDEIRITFSEKMRPGRGYSSSLLRRFEAEKGWKFPPLGESRWEDDRILVYTLKRPLEPGTTYVLPLRSAFRDWNGNPIADLDFVFTTGGR